MITIYYHKEKNHYIAYSEELNTSQNVGKKIRVGLTTAQLTFVFFDLIEENVTHTSLIARGYNPIHGPK